MARYKHVVSGVVVEADDALVLGSEWESADKPARGRAKKSDESNES